MAIIEQVGSHTYPCHRYDCDSYPKNRQDELNLLVLYDEHSTFTSTVQEYLLSFSKYSKHNVFYASGTKSASCFYDMNAFDAVLLNYSVRLSSPNFISPFIVKTLKSFKGLKVLFVQYEYETTETTRGWMETLGIHLVFSVVPPEFMGKVYPPERFPNTEFVSTLTGFVPETLAERFPVIPMADRPLHIGYRGRELPYWYGSLGREKLNIGVQMKKLCLEKNIPHDIEWDCNQRIYGDDWYHFLSSCRATLGTESGANVFDDFGDIRKNITNALNKNPGLSYEEAYQQYVQPYDGLVRMNQISPKIFEAIILKTALILFEGSYSSVIQPHTHYIPLKKDFSNVNEVFEKLEDLNYLESLTQRAYQDIVTSGKYSYKSFINRIDALISERVQEPRKSTFIKGLVGMAHSSVTDTLFPYLSNYANAIPLETILDKPLPRASRTVFYGPDEQKYVVSHTCPSCGGVQLKSIAQDKGKKSFWGQIGKECKRFFKKRLLRRQSVFKTPPSEYQHWCQECLKNTLRQGTT